MDTTSPMPLLELRAISSSYVERGQRLPVLDGCTMSVMAGEFVALLGPSGCGKSTLLDIVAGLLEADAGTVHLSGNALPAASRIGHSAYMRQRDLLLPWRNVLANAALGLEAAGVSRDEARRAAQARLAEFGLAEFARAYPAQLSGGMRQRAAFLRTVLAGQPLLLLDEPFGALDALTRTALQEWLGEMIAREGRTTVLVTHDVDEAILLADRVLVLTQRPAQVAHEERIALPRPRRRTLLTDPAFIAHKASLLARLGVGGEEGAA